MIYRIETALTTLLRPGITALIPSVLLMNFDLFVNGDENVPSVTQNSTKVFFYKILRLLCDLTIDFLVAKAS